MRHNQVLNVPNIITVLRLPLCLYSLYTYDLVMFLCSWGLDMVDGTIARILKQESQLGATLDILTDCLSHITGCVFVLAENEQYFSYFCLIFVLILITWAIYLTTFFSSNQKIKHGEDYSSNPVIRWYLSNRRRNMLASVILTSRYLLPFFLVKSDSAILFHYYAFISLASFYLTVARVLSVT